MAKTGTTPATDTAVGQVTADPVQDSNPPTQEQSAARPTKARALVDVKLGDVIVCAGQLVEADADAITALGDQVDAHPDAVAHAKALKKAAEALKKPAK